MCCIYFQEYDGDNDSQITFHEFALNGGLDKKTAQVLTENFILPSGEIDQEKLSKNLISSSGSDAISANIISDFNDLFSQTDLDKVRFSVLIDLKDIPAYKCFDIDMSKCNYIINQILLNLNHNLKFRSAFGRTMYFLFQWYYFKIQQPYSQ